MSEHTLRLLHFPTPHALIPFALVACGGVHPSMRTAEAQRHYAVEPVPVALEPTDAASLEPVRGEGLPLAAKPVAANLTPTIDAELPLDPVDAVDDPICTIRGSGRPFDGVCGTGEVLLTASPNAKDIVAAIDPHSVDVVFQLVDESSSAFATVVSGGVRVRAFWPLDHETFRLRKEASALGGHVHLKSNSPVAIRWISREGIAVRTDDLDVNLDELDARASCSSLAFDQFKPLNATLRQPHGEVVVPVGSHLTLRTSSNGPAAFVLTNDAHNDLGLGMQVFARRPHRLWVGFETTRARFAVWVDAAEVRPRDAAIDEGFGLGHGCGRLSDGRFSHQSQLTRDADALVRDWPSVGGPASVRFLKGARVFAERFAGAWVSVSPVDSVISAPKGLHFWIPRSALR